MKKHVPKLREQDYVCLYLYWQNLPAWIFICCPNKRPNLSCWGATALGSDSPCSPYLLQIKTSFCVTIKRKEKKECWIHLIGNFKRLIDRFRLNVTCDGKKGVRLQCVQKFLQKLGVFLAILWSMDWGSNQESPNQKYLYKCKRKKETNKTNLSPL